ncbi:MAG: MFS transporter [Planctomycetota bacterium]|nr:MFS transporter [Planctomycetota bacterium]
MIPPGESSPAPLDTSLTNSVDARATRNARLSLALLLSINLFNYVDRTVLAAVVPRIRETFFPNAGVHGDLGLTGTLATAFILSYMIAAPIFGWLADRMSRWVLAGISVILWSIFTGCSGLATTFTVLVMTRAMVGIGEAGYGPSAPTIIADLYPVERRGSVLAWFYMAIPVGSAVGYVLGGQIAAMLNWRWAFFAVVPPGILMGLLCFFMKDPARGSGNQAAPRPTARWKDYLKLLRNRSYVLDTLGMAAMTFAIGGISFWMPTYIAEVRRAGDLAHVNLVFGGITIVAGIAATLLGGIAGDKLRPRYSGSYFLVSGIGILLACPFVLLMLVVPFPYAWGCFFVAEFFLFFNTGPSNTILANVTHPSVRATAFAMNIFVIHALGDAPSPPLLGSIADHFGWNAAFCVVTALLAIGGVLWLIGSQFLAEDGAAAARQSVG